jgi:hypothetical protein
MRASSRISTSSSLFLKLMSFLFLFYSITIKNYFLSCFFLYSDFFLVSRFSSEKRARMPSVKNGVTGGEGGEEGGGCAEGERARARARAREGERVCERVRTRGWCEEWARSG